MANLTSQDNYIRTALRLPRDTHAEIQASAERNQRSMNAEIVARLEQSFDPGSNLLDLNWLELVEALQRLAQEKGASISISIGTKINE